MSPQAIYPKFFNVYDPADPPQAIYPLIEVLNMRRISRVGIDWSAAVPDTWTTILTVNFTVEVEGPLLILFVGWLAAYGRGTRSQMNVRFKLDGVVVGEIWEMIYDSLGGRQDLHSGGCVPGYSSNVSAGSHTLEVQVYNEGQTGSLGIIRGHIFIFELAKVIE